jgi:Zn-dependent protease with chaperone function
MRIERALAAAALCLACVAAVRTAPQQEDFSGYAEWRKGDALIVDGQRLRWQSKAKFKGEGAARDFDSVPLGYEVNATGIRQEDGSVLVKDIQAKPNGDAMFKKDAIQATDQMEAQWLRASHVVEPGSDGQNKDMGRLHTSGPDVDRVRSIVNRLIPPYKDPASFRVYVVENKEWNAFACANGMIVVHDSLLHATDDDEMAIVLGHELVHATHEHTRKQMRSNLFKVGLPALAADAALAGRSSIAAQGLGAAGAVALGAIQNGYSRGNEDQADRVGLRYAFEGRFDVRKGPALWNRFAEKYGDQDKVTNALFGNHSRASARAVNLRNQIAWNYSGTEKPGGGQPTDVW